MKEPASPAMGSDHDPEEDHSPQHKKSVLAKVKEKAIRWRQNLRKKKQSQDGNATPSRGVSLDDEDDGPDGDPEYLGAPMYESELAPEVLKETARQHPREVQVISEQHVLPFPDNSSETSSQERENPPNSPKQKPTDENKVVVTNPTKTLTESVTAKIAPAYETVTEKLAPAYATLSEKTHSIAAKFQSLFQKFEPGDDEKALSKVITEAISPKRSPDGKGVVEKVRDAVSSLLRTEEATPSKCAASTTATVAAPSISTTTPFSKSKSTNTTQTATRNSSPALSTTSTNKPYH